METQEKMDVIERKVLISSKIPQELEEKIKKIADSEKRTLSNTIFILLDTHPRLADETFSA